VRLVGGAAVLSVAVLGQLLNPLTTASAATKSPSCRALEPFFASDFPRSPRIDNRWLPMRPGIESVLSGTVREDDGKLHQHVIRSTVSTVTKVINGVQTRVLFERDYEDGLLQESELAFEAQDRDGTVWNLGEYPEEYEEGSLAGAPSTWIAGLAGARAGVNMPAHPSLRTPAYRQGVARSVGFLDCARFVRTSAHTCWAGSCTEHALVSDEWAPLDPEGGHQLKYYVADIGVVRVGAVDGVNPEVLRLTHRTRLTASALHRIDLQVLAQDRRGYRVSPHVYGKTKRATISRDLSNT
jgi:hypothetical protein